MISRSLSIRLVGSWLLSQFFIFIGSNPADVLANWRDYLIDSISIFLLTFLIWTWLEYRIQRLDAMLPWTTHFARRMWVQVLQCVLLPGLICIVWMVLHLRLFYAVALDDTTFWQYELPIAVVVFGLLNAIYTGYAFYRKTRHDEQRINQLHAELFSLQNLREQAVQPVAYAEMPVLPTPPNPNRPRTFLAVAGNRHIPIAVSEIAVLFKEADWTMLQTFDKEQYMFTDALDELMALLDPTEFFRANRQFIVSRRACRFFTTEPNGKLALHLSPESATPVVISQKKATEFRQWLNG